MKYADSGIGAGGAAPQVATGSTDITVNVNIGYEIQ